MVGTKVHDWNIEVLVLRHQIIASMVPGVVQQELSAHSPIQVSRIKVSHKLQQEEEEGVLVVHPLVYGVVEPAEVGNSSYDAYLIESLILFKV